MNIDSPHETHIPKLRALWQEAFGDTKEFLNNFGKTAYSSNRCRCITSNNDVVAALYWFNCIHNGRQLAYLYAIATAKAYRGQGLCHKLINDTHLHLAKLGYEGVILVPGSNTLFELYESMGYQTCSHIRKLFCTGAASKIALSPIGRAEYAKLRRKLLPVGGVVQENENLDFLQTQAKFFAGSKFLLAARGEADTLYGVELLGDTTVAPRIVHALGYTNGIFRTPGNELPFAMYAPLGCSKHLPPTYFGLAFD